MEYLNKILSYPVETILIIASIIITFATFYVYSGNNTIHMPAPTVEGSTEEAEHTQTITVDLAGSVEKPDVYTIPSDATLSELIKRAGGFSKDADTDYISRSINLARNVTDKEKVYIPSKDDIEEGYMAEPQVLGDTIQQEEVQNTSHAISINSSSEKELDLLPGVGPTTAKKIIENRPYTTIEDLLTKKITSQSTFNKIKDMVRL